MDYRRALRNSIKRFAGFFKGFPKPSADSFLISLVLLFNFIIALSIRLLPLKYGIYLNEFDPYFQYYQTKWIVDQGWYGFIAWFFQGVNKLMWYPSGRDIPATAYPGVPFFGAFVYLILKGLGLELPLMYVVGFIPAFSGALTTILLYFIGKEVHSRTAGLLASFFFAISAATITRTSYGFFDDDSISQIYIALFALSFIKSMKGKSKVWPIVAGISLSLLSMTWGAYVYVVDLLALTFILLILLRRADANIINAYLIAMTITLITIAIIPRSRGFFSGFYVILPILGYILVFSELYLFKRLKGISMSRLVIYSISLIAGFLAISYLLERFGIIKGIAGKLLIVINPFTKSGNPWLESVGEHFATTWAQFFLNFNIMFIMLPLGIYIIAKRARNEDIFLLLLALTSLHATASTNRLFMLSTQPVVLLGSIGFTSLIAIYAAILRQRKEYLERRRARLFKGIPTSYGALLIIILILLTMFTSMTSEANPLRVSSIPPSILSTETGSVTYDWIATFEWIKNNLPQNAVIASWWDYGYWITVNTGRISIADNANYNYTQIYLLARALVSDENTSLKIFKSFGAQYVLVYEQMYNYGGSFIPIGGDLEKSYWMIRIAYNYTDQQVRQLYLNQTTINLGGQGLTLNLPIGSKAKDAVIYKLLFNTVPGVRAIYSEIMSKINISPPVYFTLVYQSPSGYVLIYKINYPES